MTCKIYASDEYKQYADKIISNQSFIDVDDIVSVPHGVVVANGRHSNGVYNRFGAYVKQSDITKGKYWHHRVATPFCAADEYMDINVMYMGNVHWSFGHFLLEHTNRMWAIGARPVDKYVFIHSKLTKGKVPEFVYKFMEMAGVSREDILVVNKNTRFKNVYVPAAASGRDFTSDAWGRAFDNMTGVLQKSRGGLPESVSVKMCFASAYCLWGRKNSKYFRKERV